jgi:hypothetical protein
MAIWDVGVPNEVQDLWLPRLSMRCETEGEEIMHDTKFTTGEAVHTDRGIITLDESMIELSLKLAVHEGRVSEYARMLKQLCDEADKLKQQWDALPPYTPGEYSYTDRNGETQTAVFDKGMAEYQADLEIDYQAHLDSEASK